MHAKSFVHSIASIFKTSVAEPEPETDPEPHHSVGAGAVTRCDSGSGSDNGIKHG
jgi:hypothetical protein